MSIRPCVQARSLHSRLEPIFVIRATALLTHIGLVAKCLYVLACKHAVRIAAWQHFRNKIRRISNLWLTTSRLRYPSSDYLVHWTKPLFSETSVFRFYSIFNCVPQFLYLPLLSFHSFYYISFYLVIFSSWPYFLVIWPNRNWIFQFCTLLFLILLWIVFNKRFLKIWALSWSHL